MDVIFGVPWVETHGYSHSTSTRSGDPNDTQFDHNSISAAIIVIK